MCHGFRLPICESCVPHRGSSIRVRASSFRDCSILRSVHWLPVVSRVVSVVSRVVKSRCVCNPKVIPSCHGPLTPVSVVLPRWGDSVLPVNGSRSNPAVLVTCDSLESRFAISGSDGKDLLSHQSSYWDWLISVCMVYQQGSVKDVDSECWVLGEFSLKTSEYPWLKSTVFHAPILRYLASTLSRVLMTPPVIDKGVLPYSTSVPSCEAFSRGSLYGFQPTFR